MPLPRNAYTDAALLDEEWGRHFAARCFVGTAMDFSAVGQYRAWQLGHYALTCRRTADGVRAFNNVCLHRNALIDPPGCGKRAFCCRYHGWRYGDDGALTKAPFVELEQIANRQLPQYPVAESSGLYFAGLNGDEPPLDEVTRLAQRLQWQYAAPFDTGELEHACNWKLLVENVLEAYHVGFVHQKTFGQAGAQPKCFDEIGQGDYTLWQLSRPETGDKLTALAHLPGAAAHYLHGYIFPNVFLANTNNLIGYLGWLEPLAVNRTVLHWQLFELPALQQLPNNVREQIRQQAITTNRAVLEEDKPIVESCQQGLASVGGQPYQLQSMESQIKAFHAMYMRSRKG